MSTYICMCTHEIYIHRNTHHHTHTHKHTHTHTYTHTHTPAVPEFVDPRSARASPELGGYRLVTSALSPVVE